MTTTQRRLKKLFIREPLMREINDYWQSGTKAEHFITRLTEFFDPTEIVLILRAAKKSNLLVLP